MEVVLVVAEVLWQRLLVPAVEWPDIELVVAVGIVLWGLGGSIRAWEVVLQYLQTIILISGGGIPWSCR